MYHVFSSYKVACALHKARERTDVRGPVTEYVLDCAGLGERYNARGAVDLNVQVSA
jgi:hypothetical protein